MEAFAKEGVQVVAISVDSREDSLNLAQSKGIPFPLLSDPGMRTIKAYGVADTSQDIAVPSVFLVGVDGIIVWSHVGEFIARRPSAEKLLEILSDYEK